jgi:N-acyl-D-aspartate/D-glutamate deacylase
MMKTIKITKSHVGSAFLLIAGLAASSPPLFAEDYDVVINGGRVMDPATGLDSVRNVGIRDGKVIVLSRDTISGKHEVDATGLVVAPGFIDLHAHGQREFEAGLQAQDGVTTQLEMEGGAYPIDSWYEQRGGATPINYGATVGHIGVRIATLLDLESLGVSEDDMASGLLDDSFDVISKQREWMEDPATADQLTELQERIQQGLDQGALGIGYGINYTAGARREEIIKMFEVAGRNGVTNFVHSRFMAEYDLGGSVDAIQELLADAAITGSSLHIVHIGSSGGNQVPLLLNMLDQARTNGMDVTTEVYPYTAWSTFIGASIFNGDFTTALGLDYGDIELPENGERLTEAAFHRIRTESPGTIIVGHGMKEVNVTAAISHPGVMIASDGMIYVDGRAHPRGAGTFSRVLGRYVREKGALSLMDALGKMSYLPAKRLERAVPQMRTKGRISVGADADIVVFDPDRVIDRATFNEPARPSEGIEYVLVNGEFIVLGGELLENTYPGRPIRRQSH